MLTVICFPFSDNQPIEASVSVHSIKTKICHSLIVKILISFLEIKVNEYEEITDVK